MALKYSVFANAALESCPKTNAALESCPNLKSLAIDFALKTFERSLEQPWALLQGIMVWWPAEDLSWTLTQSLYPNQQLVNALLVFTFKFWNTVAVTMLSLLLEEKQFFAFFQEQKLIFKIFFE